MFGEWQRQSIVARTNSFQPGRERPGEIQHRNLVRLEFRAQLGDRCEEDIRAEIGHMPPHALNWNAGSAAMGTGNSSRACELRRFCSLMAASSSSGFAGIGGCGVWASSAAGVIMAIASLRRLIFMTSAPALRAPLFP